MEAAWWSIGGIDKGALQRKWDTNEIPEDMPSSLRHDSDSFK